MRHPIKRENEQGHMKKMGGQNDKMNDKLIDIISNTIYSSQKGDEASRMSYPKAS